jgi:hypothetical protein
MFQVIYESGNATVFSYSVNAVSPEEARAKAEAFLAKNPEHDVRSDFPEIAVRVEEFDAG